MGATGIVLKHDPWSAASLLKTFAIFSNYNPRIGSYYGIAPNDNQVKNPG
jgi:hypothetical protein